MTMNEFSNVWKTLCTYYDKNENSKELIDIYFSGMKYINNNYDELMRGIFRKCKFFPKVAEIMEIWEKTRKEHTVSININEPVCDCNLCEGTGYRLINEVSPQGGIYTFAAACDCANGDNKLYDGRTIKDAKHRSNYICPRYSSIMPG